MKIIQSTLSLLSKMFFHDSYSFFIIPTLILFRNHFPAITMQNGRVHQQLLIEVEQIPISQYCRTLFHSSMFARATATTGAPLSQKCAYETTRGAGGVSPARRSSLFRAVFHLRHIYCLCCLSLCLLLGQFMGV